MNHHGPDTTTISLRDVELMLMDMLHKILRLKFSETKDNIWIRSF